MQSDDLWSIGELAEHAGVTVKTVRFYSDRGLLPEAGRSSGGHRRYGPEALDRLRLIRSLRGLDLPVPEVGRILAQEDGQEGLDGALEDAIAGRLRELGSQLTALRWREAALQLLRDCTAEERADRLRLIGAVATPPSTAPLARFWRFLLPPRLPARLRGAIIEAAVPQPPADPTPDQVLTFARLHALTSGARFDSDFCRPEFRCAEEKLDPAVLYQGLGDAYALAGQELRAGRTPGRGEALDCFVAAHAEASRLPDSPAFRLRLAGTLTVTADPLVDRYWQLAGELVVPPTGPAEPNMGASHEWLRVALDAELSV
ncbi:MerR family transcriptional regulator [Streptacidiphilus carbonis]|uniref:MerR family transcriptional regulator n=1 Tax=Streptacidiphilus carbonis TaxID=105422 RepID=UPI0005A7128C|nr:MerR family transcriptional regulator [Streptacidiphilus carbonis]